MPTTSLQPTSNTTPNLGGTSPVTGATNTGHDPTTSSRLDTGSEIKTCRWSAFQAAGGQLLSINLKYDWAHSGNFSLSSETGDGSANISVSIEYSLNGGSNWILARSAGDSGVVIGNDTDSGSIPNTNGSDSFVIPSNTPIGNIQVRDSISANLTVNGDCSGSAEATLDMSNIRLEVVTQDQTHMLVMM